MPRALFCIVLALSIGCDSSRPVTDGYLGDTSPLTDAQPADARPADLATVVDAPLVDATTAADAQPVDASTIADLNTDFPQLLDGVWLMGWIGGLNRLSWIRFDISSPMAGTAIINSGTLSGGTMPYWNCSGVASWNVTAQPNTFQLHYPSAECTGMRSGTFVLTRIGPPTRSYPNVQMEATFDAYGVNPSAILGYKFPPDQCDAAMTSCTDPF